MAKQTLNVEGMTCGHCKMTVENSVSDLDGVTSAKVNLKKQNVTFKYDESMVSLDQVKEAINASGYQVV